MRILAGDIGGTNTRLTLFTKSAEGLRPDGAPIKFKNADFASLDAILERCAEHCAGVSDACFGIAGPVEGRRVRLTNIPHWPEVNADEIGKRLAIGEPHRVNLINDMAAHAASLSSVSESSDVTVINFGQPRKTGTQAIVMPGTGLGVGSLVWDPHGGLHRPIPSEGGHQDLPARDADTERLIASMRLLFPNQTITREYVISGPGLRAIYACLRDGESPSLEGVPPAETFLGLEETDPIAKRTLDVFAKLLGEMCGNVAFGYLSTGGIYLAGSIATSLRKRLSSRLFLDAFMQSGPPNLQALISSIPLRLVTYADTGLLGAATYATWAGDRKV